MNTDMPEFLTQYDQSWLLGTGLLIAATVGVLIWILYKLRHPSDEKRIEKILKELSIGYARNVILSDGLYGYHFIDYLVLLQGRILILGVQDYEGYIFGGEKIEEWAQVLNNRSHKFDNPLINIKHYTQAIHEIAGNVEIVGRVVFAGKCSFPKGVPSGAVQIENFYKELESIKNLSSNENSVKPVWDKIIKTSQSCKTQYQNDLKAA